MKRDFFWYEQEMLMNFINGIRAMLLPELNDGAPIEPHMVTASWQDGAIDQVQVLTDVLHAELHENNLTIDNKHSAARTGVKQAANLGGQCPTRKLVEKG